MYVASDVGETMFLREESNTVHCTQCGEAFLNREALHNHVCLRQTQQNHWSCSTCGMHFGAIFYLKEHMKSHELHDTAKELDSNDNYSSLPQVKKVNLFYKCALCGKQFATPGELERHVRCHALPGSHTCGVCKKEFKLAESLDVHMWSHLKYMPAFGDSNQSSNPVSTPSSSQSPTQNLQDNNSQIKQPNGPKVQVCEICNKAFRNASYFQLHLRTHAGDKTYSCQVCAKSFSCSWNLKTHLAVHRDEKPYSCSICGVGFKLKPNMQRHERSHQPHERLAAACRAEQSVASNSNSSNLTPLLQNGISGMMSKIPAGESQQLLPDSMDGPCTCSFCGKMFSCAAHLKSHLSVHISNRPYSCSTCGMGFKVKANMLRHERLHENSGHPPSSQPSVSANGWNGLNSLNANMSSNSKSDAHLTSAKHNSDNSNQSVNAQNAESGNTLSASNVLNVNMSNKLDVASYTPVGANSSSNDVLKDLADENSNSVMTNADDEPQFLRLEASKPQSAMPTESAEVLSRVLNCDRRHTCKICGKTYKQRCHLLSHMISHSDERPYVCDFCGKSFSLSWNLKTHLAVHNQEKPFSCSVCGNSFKLKTALQRHERSHLSRGAQTLNPNQHSLTPLTSGTQSNSSNHVTTEPKPQSSDQHGTNDGKGPKANSCISNNNSHDYSYVCEICSQSFGTCDDLQIHLQLHADKDTFACDVCGKTFPLADTLKLHFACHSDLNLFTCDACGSSFRLKAGLSRHLRIHTGPMPYVCTFCGKSFLESSALKCHVRTHTGERPYPCDHCGKRFVDSGALKRHVRIHTGEKPYTCAVCEKRFTTSTQLQIHTQMHS